MKLPPPKTTKQEVLLTLIQRGEVSLMDFQKLHGFRNRCSELVNDHGLKTETKMLLAKNKYGRTIRYGLHSITDRDKAIEIYLKLQK